MDPGTAAVMVMLSCNSSLCQPMNSSPVPYSSMDDCQTALAARLAPWPNGEMVGRCTAVDMAETRSIPEGYAAVQVTRGVGANAATTTYFVPHGN
ncbi:hypothetical protein EB233_17830 [Mesorhizobium erdmanii]|uniref:Uncharacterized protein n=1 Tax=Mesorhizobium erdmanii TaxID=1777866 RepID=A0A6M7UVI9_9HYPH|nr:hypothetical protein EB233_17830 [Mesorhizobium erdmanii]